MFPAAERPSNADFRHPPFAFRRYPMHFALYGAGYWYNDPQTNCPSFVAGEADAWVLLVEVAR